MSLRRLFQLTPLSFVFNFGNPRGLHLYINADPRRPRLYLVTRSTRELIKHSIQLSRFGLAMRNNLSGAELLSVEKLPSERVVSFSLTASNQVGESRAIELVAQLTGRSANLLLLDSHQHVTHVLRHVKGEGQQIGEKYRPPVGRAIEKATEELLVQGTFLSMSAAADYHYKQLEDAESLAQRVRARRESLQAEIRRHMKLKQNLEADLARHGDAEQHKRVGELLLANLATAQRRGDKTTVIDLYSEDQSSIDLEIDQNISLKQAAARYFARYTKAKRAAAELSSRLEQVENELAKLHAREAQVEEEITSGEPAVAETDSAQSPKRAKKSERIPGIRRYLSSDGYEILVGRAARHNDELTFRTAQPNDLWLHAADYPGSHVIIRKPNRLDIPHRTIVEAAQVAAKFSQAGKDSKVAVHYTQRKYLAKPKGAAPGLVRMSSFRTIIVKPTPELQRI